MKSAVLNVKVDEKVKKRAQAVAGSFGIPLSTLVNAYLIELAETGQVHFGTIEVMTPKMEMVVEQAQKEIDMGDTVGPFDTAEEAVNYLKKL
jgi:addiction module RelB/DinJ family antitoxin